MALGAFAGVGDEFFEVATDSYNVALDAFEDVGLDFFEGDFAPPGRPVTLSSGTSVIFIFLFPVAFTGVLL